MATYGEARRNRYRADIDAANNYYRTTKDLEGSQERSRQARMSWERDILRHYRDVIDARRKEFIRLHAGVIGERVYGTLDTGETVRVPSSAWLALVSDTVGAPAEPPAARLVGPMYVRNERDTWAGLIQKAK